MTNIISINPLNETFNNDNEPISEQSATVEIESYMAWPAQTLSYKIGQLKIIELRNKYKNQLGNKFSIRDFHDAILEGGCMPLTLFSKVIWTIGQIV